MGQITNPNLLDQNHNIEKFSCGVSSLDEWLKKRALKNQDKGASKTFVTCKDNQVIGYYALATGSVDRMISPGAIARNMPNEIPVIILGRLAVDVNFQGCRIGSHLLKDAILRTISVSQQVGVKCLLVHAISEEAQKFYMGFGFQASPIDPMTLLLSVQNTKCLLLK